MNNQYTHSVLLSKSFQPTDNLIVTSIAVSISWHLTHLLQGVHNYQSGAGVFPKKESQLLIQSIANLFGAYSKEKFSITFHTKHSGHTFLQSLIIILQSQIEYRSGLFDLILPDRLSGTNMVGKLRH